MDRSAGSRPTAGEAPPSHDPGAEAARERADAVGGVAAAPLRTPEGHLVRFGTASWTDPTITRKGVFYPASASSPEERLRFYASRFSLVEVDSTYYALPARRMAELWVERTPDHFTFDVKAHALMTGQPSEIARLPEDLRRALPADLQTKARIYGKDLATELYGEVWRRFLDALAPLHASGKLGAVMLQYPRWFLPGRESRAQIVDAWERLADVPATVELRNALWFSARNTPETIRFFREQGIPFVMVDEPQGLRSSVPPIVAVTASRLAAFRFHGRRADTWERGGVPVAEKYRYLYDRHELEAWVPRVREAADAAREVHVIMNNCYANYGTTNALEIAALVSRVYGTDAG